MYDPRCCGSVNVGVGDPSFRAFWSSLDEGTLPPHPMTQLLSPLRRRLLGPLLSPLLSNVVLCRSFCICYKGSCLLVVYFYSFGVPLVLDIAWYTFSMYETVAPLHSCPPERRTLHTHAMGSFVALPIHPFYYYFLFFFFCLGQSPSLFLSLSLFKFFLLVPSALPALLYPSPL